MKKRATILLFTTSAFIAAVLLLPEVPGMKPSRLAKQLPESFGDWVGRPVEPGEKEKKILAQDTEFERMSYYQVGSSLPPIEASIVFSGKNLSQSIHRPEVCLQAQGWVFVSENYYKWEDVLPGGESLPVKEIICKRTFFDKSDEGDLIPRVLEDGTVAEIWRSFYYTFIGHDQVVSGHYERTGIDIKDRLLKGYDQRWAYATFSSFITKKHAEQGFRLAKWEQLDEDGIREHVVRFLQELTPRIMAPPGEGVDDSIPDQ